jgi:hypothetical protein
MSTTTSPPLPVALATSTIANQINYRLSRPFLAPLFLAVIDVTLDSRATAPALVGTITPGTTTRAGFANLQANQAKFNQLLSFINQANLSILLKWDTVTLVPVDISCSTNVVVVSPSP